MMKAHTYSDIAFARYARYKSLEDVTGSSWSVSDGADVLLVAKVGDKDPTRTEEDEKEADSDETSTLSTTADVDDDDIDVDNVDIDEGDTVRAYSSSSPGKIQAFLGPLERKEASPFR